MSEATAVTQRGSLLSVRLPDVEAIVDATEILSPALLAEQTSIKTISREVNLETIELEEQLASLLLLEPLQLDVDDTQRFNWQAENVGLKNSLQSLSDNLKQSAQESQTGASASIEALVGLSVGITSGFLVWVLRGGALLASVFSVTPLWRQLDPLPIVNSSKAGGSTDAVEDQEVEHLFENR